MHRDTLKSIIESISPTLIYGRVVAVRGMLVEIAGPIHEMSVGSVLDITTRAKGGIVPCEVVGFHGNRALCLPFGPLEGVRHGCKAHLRGESTIRPDNSWLGRVLNARAQPVDGGTALVQGPDQLPLKSPPPPAHERGRVGGPLDLGVRALNTFVTCCRGQRLGIFAGSGVGKSVLLSMLARNAAADVTIVGLIGERGREVQEFIEDDLGPEGLKNSIVVVATSDESPLMRRQAAYLTLTLCEFFRDQGKQVLCLMDSVTRFAQAQREIGLSAGEPPTTKGYTPTVFSELPRLLERAGPGAEKNGSITGLFTVLVEGDNHNEPVADAVRGILDGHVVMERAIAERGRFPAINILKSVSRTLPDAADPNAWPVVLKARKLMATYADMEELIRLGAYRAGSSAEVDEAIGYNDALESYLMQGKGEVTSIAEGYSMLASIFEAQGAPEESGL
ncbi:MAG: flagellum-specific ATP synthase FliI [Hyphomicrobiales bacterium]|nr:MAG: flagellum-specific ATP synthase FliI [Hyphomicrobiales bacterium]